MTRRDLVSTAAAGLAQTPARLPNFVVIFIDDMGYGDVEPFGSKLNRTPHLNRMAAEGRKLTSFYAAPVCTPSRASLMTGCYPKRVGLHQGSWHAVLMPGDRHGLHAQETTAAEILKSRGYATACIGKWHLGDQPEFLPTRHGFDLYFGIPFSNDMGPLNNSKERNFPPLPLLWNDRVVQEVKDQSFLTGAYTREAVRFILDNRNRPFFLYLPHTMMHFPIHAGEDFRGKSNNGIAGAAIEELDWSVGRILDTLRETGLDRNTPVLFTSDNGATRFGTARPLRGMKGSCFEGGMREPAIAWWPGKIPEGTATGGITSTMDILPTFARLAGTRLPRAVDGHDLTGLLTGEGN